MATGYTPQLRELGTVEGSFHATFTTSYTNIRNRLKALTEACPQDRAVTAFVKEERIRLKELWAAWKASLPSHLRPIVSSVHGVHGGPELTGPPTMAFSAFLSLYRDWEGFTRDGLAEIGADYHERSDVLKVLQGGVRSLDALANAYGAFEREEAAFLEPGWSEGGGLTEASESTHAGGFGTPEHNQAVEVAAVGFVTQHLVSEGWSVESVESARIGFDLLCRRAGEERHIEVKGTSGDEPTFILTEGELRRSNYDTEFWFYIVTAALKDAPALSAMSGRVAREQYHFLPISYRAVPKK